MQFLNGNCLLCKIQNKVLAAARACERGIQLWLQSWTECERFDTGGAFQCKNKLCRKCELCLGEGLELQLLSAQEETGAVSSGLPQSQQELGCACPGCAGTAPRPISHKGKGNCWSCPCWAGRTMGPSSILGSTKPSLGFSTPVSLVSIREGAASSDGSCIL